MIGRPPRSTLFPYPTLFRSCIRTLRGAHPDLADILGTIAVLRRGRHQHLPGADVGRAAIPQSDRKSTRLNSSHANISYAVFCLKKKKHAHSLMSDEPPLVQL